MASTGGQLAPPILGATAFVMAEFLGTTYWEIAIAATMPAVLYYTGIYTTIHFVAIKKNLRTIEQKDIPSWKEALDWKKMLPLVMGIVGLSYGVFRGNSIVYSVLLGIVWMIISYFIAHVKTLDNLKDAGKHLFTSLINTGKAIVLVGILLGRRSDIDLFDQYDGCCRDSGQYYHFDRRRSYVHTRICNRMYLFNHGNGFADIARLCPGVCDHGSGVDPCRRRALWRPICSSFTMHVFLRLPPPVCAAVFVASGIAKADWLKSCH